MKNKILPIILALVAVAAIILCFVFNGQKGDLQKELSNVQAQVEQLKADAVKAAESAKTAEEAAAKKAEELEAAVKTAEEAAAKTAEEAAAKVEELTAAVKTAEEAAAKATEEAATAKAAEEAAISKVEELTAAIKAAEEAAAKPAATVEVIDFEDGAYGFLGISKAKANAGVPALEVAEFNGSKALKVTPDAKVPYVAINVEGLAGERLADVAAISVDIGIDLGSDGKFYAASGVVYSYTGEDNAEGKASWSVYLQRKNPRSLVFQIPAFVAGAGNYVMISLEEHASADPVAFFIDNIKLLDKDGNAIALDPTAEYVAADSGRDLTNLVTLTNVVEFNGFATSGGAWAQNGFEMPQEFVDALVPGSVIEVDFESGDGALWLVFPWAEAGWMRVGGCGNGVDAVNNSGNIAQIPYELIVQFCGEDKSTWGAMLQCEGSSDWNVLGLRVGQRQNQIVLKNAVEFEGFETSGGAWSQNGFEMPQAIVDALVPGSVVEITFESGDNAIWVVMPWAAAGWSRVAQGEALIINGKAYITYDQFVAVCGEDKSTWGAMMQCEGSSDWTVYGIRVGQMGEFYGLTNLVRFEGFETSGAAWAQNGFEMPQEFVDALVPGSVVTISYESADGNIWLVMPWAAAGWSRVGNDGADVADGHIAQVTYEQIEAVCGEDKATWGAMMQCESSSDWTVYGVAVGTAMK